MSGNTRHDATNGLPLHAAHGWRNALLARRGGLREKVFATTQNKKCTSWAQRFTVKASGSWR